MLIFVNIIVWTVVLGFFVTNEWQKKANEDLIKSHHQLVKTFNRFRHYEDYEEKIPFMETQMTKEIMEQVCPIIPEGFMDEFPKPKVTNMKTERVRNEGKGKKKLVTSFSLSLNNGIPITQQTESVYQKNNDDWVMISYQLVF